MSALGRKQTFGSQIKSPSHRAHNGGSLGRLAMTIRKVSYAAFQRNMLHWIKRQERGEEIHLLQMGRVVGVLYAAPFIQAPNQNPTPRQRRHRMSNL